MGDVFYHGTRKNQWLLRKGWEDKGRQRYYIMKASKQANQTNLFLRKEYEDKIRADFGKYVTVFIPSDRKYRCCMLCTAHIHRGTFISHFMPLMMAPAGISNGIAQ